MVGLVYWRDIIKVGVKHLVVGAAISGAIILPFLYYTAVETPDQTRFEQLSIFSDPLAPIYVIRGREVDSGDYLEETVGNRVWYSYLFHNKGVEYLSSLKNNYLKAFPAPSCLQREIVTCGKGWVKLGLCYGLILSVWQQDCFG